MLVTVPDKGNPQKAAFRYQVVPFFVIAPRKNILIRTLTSSHLHLNPCIGTWKIKVRNFSQSFIIRKKSFGMTKKFFV